MLAIILVGQLLISLKSHSLVEVEPSAFGITRDDSSALPPHKDRTEGWGFTLAVGAGYYHPVNYNPNYSVESFQSIYGENKTPAADVQLQIKKGFRALSVGADLGVGFLSVSSQASSGIDSSLSLMPIRLGTSVVIDGLFKKPYIAPYASLGAYTNIYKETQAALSNGGNTQIAMYYSFGSLFLLDWLDQSSADRAYSETNLQATYIYVEGRQYMKSSNETDPDLSTGLDPNVGVRLEF